MLPNTNPTCFVVNQLTSVVEGQQQTVLGRRRRKGEEEERRRRKIRRYTGNDGDGEECGCLALFSYPGRHCMKRQSASRQAQQLRRCVGGCVGAGGGACSRQAGHGESDAVCGAGTLIYRCPPHQHQTLTGAKGQGWGWGWAWRGAGEGEGWAGRGTGKGVGGRTGQYSAGTRAVVAVPIVFLCVLWFAALMSIRGGGNQREIAYVHEETERWHMDSSRDSDRGRES